MNKLFLTIGAALLFLAAPAGAQQVTQNAISGNECWNAGQGPGGPGQFLCINQVRNGQSTAAVTGSGAVVTNATQAQSALIWSGTAPTTWTINLPVPAFDGEIFVISTDTTLTSLVTVAVAAGATMNQAYSAQTLTANTSVFFRYSAATLKWYRTQ